MKPSNKKGLPNELIDHVLSFVPKRKLPAMMRVSKTWYKSATRLCYRNVCFTSVKQREAFFAMLESTSIKGSPVSNSSVHRSPSKSVPPPVILKRKSSLRNHNKASDMAKLIVSLDFGLRPRELTHAEPQLPMTRAVLPTRSERRMTSISTSPGSAMSLDSPVKSNISFNSDTGKREDQSPVRSTSMVTRDSPRKSSRKDSASPIRQRVGAGLSISTTGSALTDTNPPSSPYGSWAHRFVSPLVPKVGLYIPNLKDLSLCGCHVNAQDFGSVLQATRLQRLDISYSTLKTDGVQLISRYCKTNLNFLNLSGIFKLGRNRSHGLVGIAMHCMDLSRIVALDCPEIYPEVLDECQVVCENRITFEMDETPS